LTKNPTTRLAYCGGSFHGIGKRTPIMSPMAMDQCIL
jgi:hypothetical protein